MDKQTSLTDHSAVRCIEDIVFAEVINEAGQPESLRLDVYLPEAAPASQLRTIVLFHGGGFRVGNDKRQRYIVLFAKAFAAAGYGVIAPDYRVRQDPGSDWTLAVRDAVDDGRMAIEWVRRNGAHYGLDPFNLVLGGGSAGGMLVTNLVHDPHQRLIPSDGVYALLNLWGPTPPVRLNDTLNLASPPPPVRLYDTLNPACPPTFIVHGTADELVPYQHSVQLAEELGAAGVPCQLLTLPGAPHTPWMHADQILSEMLAFLSKYKK